MRWTWRAENGGSPETLIWPKSRYGTRRDGQDEPGRLCLMIDYDILFADLRGRKSPFAKRDLQCDAGIDNVCATTGSPALTANASRRASASSPAASSAREVLRFRTDKAGPGVAVSWTVRSAPATSISAPPSHHNSPGFAAAPPAIRHRPGHGDRSARHWRALSLSAFEHGSLVEPGADRVGVGKCLNAGDGPAIAAGLRRILDPLGGSCVDCLAAASGRDPFDFRRRAGSGWLRSGHSTPRSGIGSSGADGSSSLGSARRRRLCAQRRRAERQPGTARKPMECGSPPGATLTHR